MDEVADISTMSGTGHEPMESFSSRVMLTLFSHGPLISNSNCDPFSLLHVHDDFCHWHINFLLLMSEMSLGNCNALIMTA